jgi:hypothetical protein
MPWKIVCVRNENIVEVEYSKNNATDSSKQLPQTVKNACEKSKCKKCLVDVRAFDQEIGILVINRTPDILKKMEMIQGYFYAVLVDYNSDNFESFQLIASAIDTKNYLYDYGIKFAFFNERKKAIEWLGSR